MKSLVIAEKPSVARDIARVLNCRKKINGAIEGDRYIVTWGLGHLVTLADPEEYDTRYKEWNMDYLPMLPDPMKLVIIPGTRKQYESVKIQIKRKDVSEIIIATDAGREGELVARWILLKAGNQKPTKRLWISSVTDKAIKEGFARLKKGSEYDSLFYAASSRAEADWLVGINATRALTCKYNAQLSCGRVQTPTLYMIAKKEEEIRQFVAKNYYGLRASVVSPSLHLTWQDKRTKSSRSFDQAKMQQLWKGLNGKQCVLTSVKKTPKKTPAPLLYDLTELQRDANKKFGFSAKETLNIMQSLYEYHKVLTYPRTDSRFISKDIIPTISERLKAVRIGPYKALAQDAAKQKVTAAAFFVNDAKVSDHHAIIPTEQFVDLLHMSNEEKRIYDLVVRRFLAVLLPPYEYEQTTVLAEIGGETFIAKGQAVKSLGWKAAYDNHYEDEEEESEEMQVKGQKLPQLSQGMRLSPVKLELTTGKTKPPAPFNEATLLSAMENPSKYLSTQDKKAVKTLTETGGLGTVATRADIIDKLFHSFLIEKREQDIFTTSKGKQLLSLVPEDLKKPELTAHWEQQLSLIAKGAKDRRVFMKDIKRYSKELIEDIKNSQGTFKHDNLTSHKCPRCDKRLLLVKGKNSEMLVCQDRQCGYRETIAKVSNARCPVCHKKMKLTGSGEKQLFVCGCGYKEKLEAFKKRREKEGAGVSKRDVTAYMSKQKKEAAQPINNAFADALKNWNNDNQK